MNNTQIRIYRITSRKTGFSVTQSALDRHAAINKSISEGKFPGHAPFDLMAKLIFVSKTK